MSDPATPRSENRHEWLEVFNPGTTPVNLAGWTIADGNSADVLRAGVVGAGEYAVITAGDAVVPNGVTVVRVDDGRIGSGLNNDGDTVSLRAPDGTLVDTVSYGNESTVPAPGEGETIGREPGVVSWRVTATPTPGSPNAFHADSVEPTPAEQSAVLPQPLASAEARPGAELVESGSDGSPIPWILFGAAVGLGGFATATAAPRVAERARERWRTRGR